MGEQGVVGVDGCKGGWIVVTAGATATEPSGVRFATTVTAVVEAYRAQRIAAVAIDMPIGLPAKAPRPSDTLARELLGARRSTVFPTPARSTLGAADYPDALHRSRAAMGIGLSKQAFHLLPKIRELDDLLEPQDQPGVSEAHPELCFLRMSGTVLAPKTTSAGIGQRIAALTPHFVDLIDQLAAAPAEGKVDDVLDAYALAWTARRIAAGTADTLGDDADRDERGMQMTITV